MENQEAFIERGTDYDFEYGKLAIYETNTPCQGVEFNFDRYVITLMVSGHKTVTNAYRKVEFFPGTIFIPQKDIVQEVEIADASFTNPTQCLVLEIYPNFLEEFYFEFRRLIKASGLTSEAVVYAEPMTHFFSNDIASVEAFLRFYKYVKRAKTKMDEIVNRNILKELLFRLFQTDAKRLLLSNLNYSIKDKMVDKTLKYIQYNLTNSISIDDLVQVSNFGKTKLFNKFKEEVGVTPVQYILSERIKYSEKLIRQGESMKSVAFQSGFNTYEHYFNSFINYKVELLHILGAP